MTHPIAVQQEIVRMYSAGVSLKVIEAETGISMRTVISMVKRKKVPMRREKGKKESAILSLWHKGLNKAQIARETGYCWLTVHNTIKAAT